MFVLEYHSSSCTIDQRYGPFTREALHSARIGRSDNQLITGFSQIYTLLPFFWQKVRLPSTYPDFATFPLLPGMMLMLDQLIHPMIKRDSQKTRT